MKIGYRFMILFALFIFCQASMANSLYPFQSPKQDAQFLHLLRELRCLVCQNQDLLDSNAGLAKDLRDEVYTRVKAGQSDTDIVNYLTTRYGDFILFSPPIKSVTAVLWFGPIIFLCLGLLIFWHTSLKRTRYE